MSTKEASTQPLGHAPPLGCGSSSWWIGSLSLPGFSAESAGPGPASVRSIAGRIADMLTRKAEMEWRSFVHCFRDNIEDRGWTPENILRTLCLHDYDNHSDNIQRLAIFPSSLRLSNSSFFLNTAQRSTLDNHLIVLESVSLTKVNIWNCWLIDW